MAPTIEFEGSIVAFRLYAAWVYSGLIQKRILKIGVPGAENISYSNIGQAYILGDKLKDHKFKNAIVDCLLETIVSQGKMDLTLPNLIFDKTSASAPLKKLLVDIYVLYGHKDWLKPDGSSQTNSAIFLSDLSAAFLARHGHDKARPNNMSVLNACNYHEHPERKLCSTAKSHPREIAQRKP